MRGFLLVLFVFVACNSFGQQLPQYTQWSWHQFVTNPAHAGIKSCIDIHSLYRLQWVGFEGAPKSGFLTIAVPLSKKRKEFLSAKQGLGVKFETDRIGQFTSQRFNLAYATHFSFSKTSRLSLGLYGGVIQMGYSANDVISSSPDPVVMNQGSFFGPDASFGAWFNSTNYYVGLTFQNLTFWKWNPIASASQFGLHTVLNGGYRLAMNEEFTLVPGAQIKIPPRGPVAVDILLGLDYRNVIGLNLGYRNIDALTAGVQYKIAGQFSIAYSFDYTLSSIQLGAKNSHELSLRFTTCKPPRTGTSDCPLFE